MNASPAPRPLGELIDCAINVYRRNFLRCLLVAIVVSAPAIVLAVLYANEAGANVRDAAQMIESAGRKAGGDPWGPLEIMAGAYGKMARVEVVARLLQAISRAAVSVAMASVAVAAIRGEPVPSIGEIARRSGSRFLPALLLEVGFGFTWSASSCCCPPLFLIGLFLAPAPALLVLERGPLEASVRRALPAAIAIFVAPFAACADAFGRGLQLSMNLVVAARACLFLVILLTFVTVFAAAVITPVHLAAPESGDWFWAQHVAEAVFLPVLGLGRALWYFDLLARREGADLVSDGPMPA